MKWDSAANEKMFVFGINNGDFKPTQDLADHMGVTISALRQQFDKLKRQAKDREEAGDDGEDAPKTPAKRKRVSAKKDGTAAKKRKTGKAKDGDDAVVDEDEE